MDFTLFCLFDTESHITAQAGLEFTESFCFNFLGAGLTSVNPQTQLVLTLKKKEKKGKYIIRLLHFSAVRKT